MESSKSVWIVLLGIAVSILQFVIYQFVSDNWLGLLLGGLCLLLGSAVVHFITGEPEELLAYLLIPCVFSGSMGLLIPKVTTTLLPSANTALAGCVLAWVIPVAYACVFTWVVGTFAMEQFCTFYKKATVFFYVVYFGVMLYWFGWHSRISAADVTVQLMHLQILLLILTELLQTQFLWNACYSF